MMNKKLKILLIIVIAVILTAILYVAVIHPRIKLHIQTLRVYEEMGGGTDIGQPLITYNQYNVKDDTLKMIDMGDFHIGVPSDWEKQDNDDSAFVIYGSGRTTPDGKKFETLTSTGSGTDYSDMVILNRELYESDDLWRRVNKGFESLGYGMPTTAYDSLRCALEMRAEDYNLLDYNKSLAFTYALPFRAGSPNYYDGITSWSYLYEDEYKCGIINEMYRKDTDSYRYYLSFYDTEDLNTEYFILLSAKDQETAYAIINSLTFDD